jgi:hypothetical protein
MALSLITLLLAAVLPCKAQSPPTNQKVGSSNLSGRSNRSSIIHFPFVAEMKLRLISGRMLVPPESKLGVNT